MILSIITMLLFIIIFVALLHRYYTAMDLRNPSKVELVTLVLSTLTYILVIKVVLSYLMTFIP